MVAVGAMDQKPDFSHAGTTVRVSRIRWKDMEARFQCVRTHWKFGFMTPSTAPALLAAFAAQASCPAGPQN